MQMRSARIKNTAIGYVVIVGVAGLVTAAASAGARELSPAEVVALRFPAAAEQPTAVLSGGKTEQELESEIMFSPQPSLPLASAPALPEQALALASPDTDGPTDAVTAAPAPLRAERAEKRHAAPAGGRSSTLFSPAQIASIKERLKLTSYQEQYWPPVESALREIAWRQGHEARKNDPRKSPTIDANSPEVQRLKSAAIPLIMSMREDQKNEVRTLARVMGLESVAAQF
jgi:hypothetical protein